MSKLRKVLLMTLVVLIGVVFITGPWWFEKDRIADEAKVGVFYYPWYASDNEGGHHDWHDQVMRTKLQPNQGPALGEYNSQDPEVIGQHIAWSEMGNIKVWVSSWWGPNDYTDVTLKDHILKHPDAGNLEYAILYEAAGRLGSFEEPDYTNLYTDMAYLEETYFNNPYYLKIDDKPVVYLYLTREYFKGERIEELRKLKEEFPNLYLIGDDLFQIVNDPAKSGLLDAVNNYDVYGQTFAMGDNGGTKFELWLLAQIYRYTEWSGEKYGYDFIPSVAPGYNDTAVREGHSPAPRSFKNSSPGDVFRESLYKLGFPFLDKDADNLIMITSFNEWYEDTQIEPTMGTQNSSSTDDSETGDFYTDGFEYHDYGTDYLEILSELTGK